MSQKIDRLVDFFIPTLAITYLSSVCGDGPLLTAWLMPREAQAVPLIGEFAQVSANSSPGSYLDIGAPSSLKKMGGSEGWQEGIYASSDPSRSGRTTSQNDLGLTILPGSQNQKSDKKTSEDVTWSTRRLHRAPDTIEHSYSLLKDQDSQNLKDKVSRILRSDGGAQCGTPRTSRDKNQSLGWTEEGRESFANTDLKRPEQQQKYPSHREFLQQCGTSRLRYSAKVRGLKKALLNDQRLERMQVKSSHGDDADTLLFTRVPSPIKDASASVEKRSAMHSSSTRKSKPLPRSLTGFYPQRSNCGKSPSMDFVSDESLKISNRPGDGRPVGRQEFITVTRDQTYKRMRTELKRTKQELLERTRAESDARQDIKELRKGYDDLITSVDAYSDLRKAHNSLLLEHRQVLTSYDSLARTHRSCRTASSKKLAQRIIKAGLSPNDSAYASRSTSIAAHSPIISMSSRADLSTATQSSYSAAPPIDLTGTPSPALPSASGIYAPGIEQEDHAIEQESSNYANMNGFDDEANEMYNALWENEIVDWDAGRGGEPEA